MTATNLVYLKDAKGMTDSLAIAREFGKDHKNVLQKIHSCKGDLPAEFNRLNFQLVDYVDSKGETRPKYELTRDAFMFLVMGFTGKKASTVKLLFIEEFNRMEAQLINAGLQLKPLTIDGWYQLAKEYEQRALRAEATVQLSVERAADHAEEHGLTSADIIKKYPAQSEKLIDETKLRMKSLTKYGPSGILTIGLKHYGIISKIARITSRGPARLFNTKEVDDFMKGK